MLLVVSGSPRDVGELYGEGFQNFGELVDNFAINLLALTLDCNIER